MKLTYLCESCEKLIADEEAIRRDPIGWGPQYMCPHCKELLLEVNEIVEGWNHYKYLIEALNQAAVKAVIEGVHKE